MISTSAEIPQTELIETSALESFQKANPDLFQKNDAELFRHLGIVIALLILFTSAAIFSQFILMKIIFGALSALCWFSLINVTIHHHHTHHNAANSPGARKILDSIYFFVIPNAKKRKPRYVRAHLNHHARPFHESDLDHHYGTRQYLQMNRGFWTRCLYFLELTFIGAHVPGWEDDRYMNEIPMEKWNANDYEKVKERERKKAWAVGLFQWSLFFVFLRLIPSLAWGWIFPMLLVKNWAHYLGQFQHYEERFLEENRSEWRRTRTFQVPGWFNYLMGGEISGHFLHHLYPQIPYYYMERARQRFVQNPQLVELFLS